MKTLIRNGHIVTAVDSYVADILIDGSTISMIGKNLANVVGSVDRTIDAGGKLVIPGGIDPHTHMDLPFGGTSAADVSNRNASGGVYGPRYHHDFAVQYHGQALNQRDVYGGKPEGKPRSTRLRMIVPDLPDRRRAKAMIDQVSPASNFQAYPACSGDDGTIFKAMVRPAKWRFGLCAENSVVIDVMVARSRRGKAAPRFHALTGPLARRLGVFTRDRHRRNGMHRGHVHLLRRGAPRGSKRA
jgi:dihydropyrimidinase